MAVLRQSAMRIVIAATSVAALFVTAAQSAHAAKTSIVVGMSIEPSGLDPTAAAPVANAQVTWQNVYQGLVRVDRDGKMQPQLAESWTVSPDGLTYTFKLRTNAKFQNGVPFDSSVAKFTFDRAKAADSTNPQKQYYASITSIDTPAPDTLVLHLAAPFGDLLFRLGSSSAVMVEPSSAADDKTNPVGTGPFKLKTWIKGDRVELVRDPNYWETAKKIALDSITFRFISDQQAQVAAVLSGDVDAFPEMGAPELFGKFQNDPRFAAVIGNTELKVVAGMNSE